MRNGKQRNDFNAHMDNLDRPMLDDDELSIYHKLPIEEIFPVAFARAIPDNVKLMVAHLLNVGYTHNDIGEMFSDGIRFIEEEFTSQLNGHSMMEASLLFSHFYVDAVNHLARMDRIDKRCGYSPGHWPIPLDE